MISEIIMPDLGATGGDAIIESWLVKTGEQVQAGQPLFVVTTDKATVEVEAFRSGVIREIRRQDGETVKLGEVVGLIADPEDSLQVKFEMRPGPETDRSDPEPFPDHQATSNRGLDRRMRASPLARRLAAEHGLSLETISGSGRSGQILRRDVERALSTPNVNPIPPVEGSLHREPLSTMRRAIVTRTVQSKGNVPHFYAGLTVDMDAASEFLDRLVDRAAVRGWTRPTFSDLFLRAAGLALQRFPVLNASYQDDAIVFHDSIDVGFVVGLEEGMIIPVLRGIDRLNLYDLAAERTRLRIRAGNGRLTAGEVGRATFTVSNLGMFGLDWFAAIINPPEAGILALGSIQERACVAGGVLVPRLQLDVTLSVDHRIVDGVTAAKFLAAFKDLLEHPIDLAVQGSKSEEP